MTINDIAELAGVSVSTVSKIINGKDKGIKLETRERVLKIVKEYRYTPYDFIKNNTNSKSFLLGLVLSGIKKRQSISNGFLHEAERQGYQVQVCLSTSAESESKHIAALCKNRVEAVLWEPVEVAAENDTSGIVAEGDSVGTAATVCNRTGAAAVLHKRGIPFLALNTDAVGSNGIFYDYQKAGYTAADILLQLGHTKIRCLYDGADMQECAIRQGVERCLFDHHCLYVECKNVQEALSVHNCSALICCDWDMAVTAYEYATVHKFRIPQDLSIICIDDAEHIKSFPPISALSLSLFTFGVFACRYLIDKIEKKATDIPTYTEVFTCNHYKSIDLPAPLRKKRIIVVGSINMDILLTVNNYPQTGESISAESVSIIPGGKGINQAVGAAKLGAKVSLVGNVGRDFDGDMILNLLHDNGIDATAVHVDEEHSTGKAYIHIQGDGESGIVLYGGANETISADSIYRSEQLFTDAVFCLLQTEIPMEAVKKTIETARKYNVAIMLKPSAVKEIAEELLLELDYFIPNRKELYRLCPIAGTLEEKVAWFLKKGVKTVIVTLDSDGCYVRTSEYERWFPAVDIFKPIDTTGAADAFIAALAVFLSEQKSLSDALPYALYAAGFSTTRVGVVPSLIDRATLEQCCI